MNVSSYIVNKETVIQWAKDAHDDTNHWYDRKNKVKYTYHLDMVADIAKRYLYLIPEEYHNIIIMSCYCHDSIEDARKSWNDVMKVAGEQVADIAFALTNEKGKTREQRGSKKYYMEMCEHPLAVFVKLCDRIANTTYSNNGSSMYKVYKKEMNSFLSHFKQYENIYGDMLDELRNL